jgi:hypothetical protein
MSHTRWRRRLCTPPSITRTSIIFPLASTSVDESLRARDLSEGCGRVVRAFEPTEAEVAAGLEVSGEFVAIRVGGDAAILGATGVGGAVLLVAAVEGADAAAGKLRGL